jgi:hypothetical protein
MSAPQFGRRMDDPTELAENLKVWLDFPCPAFMEVIIDRGPAGL